MVILSGIQKLSINSFQALKKLSYHHFFLFYFGAIANGSFSFNLSPAPLRLNYKLILFYVGYFADMLVFDTPPL